MTDNTYNIPLGAKVRPSQIGYYNFWYPDEEQEFILEKKTSCEHLNWSGSDKWTAVLVSAEDARLYKSPIRVVWVEKDLFNDVRSAPIIRERLKARANEDER